MTTFTIARKPRRVYNNLFDQLFTEMPGAFRNDFNSFARNAEVPVNVKETDEGYRLEIVAPGFEKNDFKVNVEKEILTISAEKETEASGQEQKTIRKEYEFRSFKRSFTIDEKIDATKIDAVYVNGVLILTLPKKAEVAASARKIEIK